MKKNLLYITLFSVLLSGSFVRPDVQLSTASYLGTLVKNVASGTCVVAKHLLAAGSYVAPKVGWIAGKALNLTTWGLKKITSSKERAIPAAAVAAYSAYYITQKQSIDKLVAPAEYYLKLCKGNVLSKDHVLKAAQLIIALPEVSDISMFALGEKLFKMDTSAMSLNNLQQLIVSLEYYMRLIEDKSTFASLLTSAHAIFDQYDDMRELSALTAVKPEINENLVQKYNALPALSLELEKQLEEHSSKKGFVSGTMQSFISPGMNNYRIERLHIELYMLWLKAKICRHIVMHYIPELERDLALRHYVPLSGGL